MHQHVCITCRRIYYTYPYDARPARFWCAACYFARTDSTSAEPQPPWVWASHTQQAATLQRLHGAAG